MLKDEDVQCLNNQPTTNNQQPTTKNHHRCHPERSEGSVFAFGRRWKLEDRGWGRQEILHFVQNDRSEGVQNGWGRS